MEIWFFPGAPLFLQLHRAAYLVSCSTETTMELNFTNSTYFNTVYHVQLLFFTRCTRYFFQRDTSSEAVAIAISEDDPLIEIVSVFLSSALFTLGTYEPENYIIRGIHPYLVSLYCNQFSLRYRECNTQT